MSRIHGRRPSQPSARISSLPLPPHLTPPIYTSRLQADHPSSSVSTDRMPNDQGQERSGLEEKVSGLGLGRRFSLKRSKSKKRDEKQESPQTTHRSPASISYIHLASPEFVEPQPGPDYRQMENLPQPHVPVSYMSRVRTFIREFNAMPWVASGPVTVEYVPRQPARHYHSHRPLIYLESPPAQQEIPMAVDLTAGESTPSTSSLVPPHHQGMGAFTNEGQSWPVVTSELSPTYIQQVRSDLSFSGEGVVPRANGALIPSSPPQRWSPPREGNWVDEESMRGPQPTWATPALRQPLSRALEHRHPVPVADAVHSPQSTPNSTVQNNQLPYSHQSLQADTPTPYLSATPAIAPNSNGHHRRIRPREPLTPGPSTQPPLPTSPPPLTPLVAPQPRRELSEGRWRLSDVIPERKQRTKPNTMGLAIIDAIERDSDSDLDVEKQKAKEKAKQDLEDRDLQYARAVAMGLDGNLPTDELFDGDWDWEQLPPPEVSPTVPDRESSPNLATYAQEPEPEPLLQADRDYRSPINLASSSGLHNDARLSPGSPYLNPHHPYSGYVSSQPPLMDDYGPAVHAGHAGYVSSRSASVSVANHSGRASRASGSRPPSSEGGLRAGRLFSPPVFTDEDYTPMARERRSRSGTSSSRSGSIRGTPIPVLPPVTALPNAGGTPYSRTQSRATPASIWPPSGFNRGPQAQADVSYRWGRLNEAAPDLMYPYVAANFDR
ncbi:hypothetical protein Moror_6957 [Moniliophthora roreri MCA 2997]|uniref:Uncharacterized protein n=2 Tax=Moniliophthora roreri TaxID=221103 RepID=V2YXK6_MONRO|nr:hypothetical protein Moror_6957 [Moniliophthora roreri MCA 2997]